MEVVRVEKIDMFEDEVDELLYWSNYLTRLRDMWDSNKKDQWRDRKEGRPVSHIGQSQRQLTDCDRGYMQEEIFRVTNVVNCLKELVKK